MVQNAATQTETVGKPTDSIQSCQIYQRRVETSSRIKTTKRQTSTANPQNGTGNSDEDDGQRISKRIRRHSFGELSISLTADVLAGNFEAIDRLLSTMPSEVARHLLRNRFSVYAMTPLLLLPYSQAPNLSLSTVHLMVTASADTTATDTDGNTLFHLLVRKDRQQDLVALLEAVDDPAWPWLRPLVNAVNYEGRAPLQTAVLRQQRHSVEALLRAGADVNFETPISRLTALHYAVLDGGSVPIASLLLACPGINVNPLSVGRETPLDMLGHNKNMELQQILEREGVRRMHLFGEGEDEDEDEEYTDDEEFYHDEARNLQLLAGC